MRTPEQIAEEFFRYEYNTPEIFVGLENGRFVCKATVPITDEIDRVHKSLITACANAIRRDRQQRAGETGNPFYPKGQAP